MLRNSLSSGIVFKSKLSSSSSSSSFVLSNDRFLLISEDIISISSCVNDGEYSISSLIISSFVNPRSDIMNSSSYTNSSSSSLSLLLSSSSSSLVLFGLFILFTTVSLVVLEVAAVEAELSCAAAATILSYRVCKLYSFTNRCITSICFVSYNSCNISPHESISLNWT